MASTENLFSLDDSEQRKEKSPSALRTISEAAEMLDVPQHVLRFWETKFSQIKPLKRNGGRRFYRPQDLEVLQQIKHLLYSQGYTIKGAKKAVDEFIHARATSASTNAAEWLAEVPPANVNDNYNLEAEPDMLAELAIALKEEESAEDDSSTSIRDVREDVLALRADLLRARDVLQARLTASIH
jgi:DNA-binding transcriptional MerR regulator